MIKKVAFIGPLPPPLGGVAVINQSFQALDYNGYEVISFDTAEKKDREDLYSKFKLKSIQRNIKIGKKLKQFIEKNKPDVINIFITSGMSILRDILFLKNLSKYNIPIIIHFHSKTEGEFALTPKRLKRVAKYFNKYASRIILLSEYHYSFFTKYFGEEKCVVVENFVNYTDFVNEIKDKNEDFLFVGRLSKEKGFFDLLEAAKKLKKSGMTFQIDVIGAATNEDMDNKIRNFIKRNELELYVTLLGARFNKEKLEYFKENSILLFPSHFENSPVVLKEGIASKMAILCSDIDANTYILGNANNHLVHRTGDFNDLADKMKFLIQNPSRVAEMCKESAKNKKYDKKVAQLEMMNLIHELS